MRREREIGYMKVLSRVHSVARKMNEILIPINIYYFVKDRGERVLIRSFISKNLHFLFFFLLTAIKLIVIKFVHALSL